MMRDSLHIYEAFALASMLPRSMKTLLEVERLTFHIFIPDLHIWFPFRFYYAP